MKIAHSMVGWLLLSSAVWGQDWSPAEMQLAGDLKQFRSLHGELDSLNRVLQEETSAIDRMKKDPNADRAQIENLMSRGLVTGDQIRERRREINRIESQINDRFVELSDQWKTAITALEKRMASTGSADEVRSLEKEIAQIREKQIYLSPSVRTLSFDPARVYAIDLRTLADSLERRLAADYLRVALLEVQARQREIRQTKDQCRAVLVWEDKISTFAEEAQDRRFSPFLASPRRTFSSGTGVSSGVSGDIQNNVGSTEKLLYQLKPSSVERVSSNYTATTGTDLKEYFRLLGEVDGELDKLAKMISKKLP